MLPTNKNKKAFQALAPTEIYITRLVGNSWLNTKYEETRVAWETVMQGGDAG